MCGIVGYLGSRNAATVLFHGLKRIEYRGYDSAGVALLTPRQDWLVRKAIKPSRGSAIDELEGPGLETASGGIGHTRWATHGAVSERNTHPHTDCSATLMLVHNGMLANFLTLRKSLEKHRLASETDTELLAHLIEEEYQAEVPLEDAVRKALKRVDGTYGLAVMSRREPGKIVCARNGTQPIAIGLGEKEIFIASDEGAFVAYTRRLIDLDDGEIAAVTVDGIIGTKKTERYSSLDAGAEGKGQYPSFMLKEIFEQPTAIDRAMNHGGRLLQDLGDVKLGGLDLLRPELRKIQDVALVACGTAYHAGQIGAAMFAEFAGIPYSRAIIASELNGLHVDPDKTAVVAISQSGETADTLSAVAEAIRKGALPIGIINREASSLSRICRQGVYCNAGAEIAVASTKAFTSQVVVLALVALMLGRQRQVSLSICAICRVRLSKLCLNLSGYEKSLKN